jgi:hypothetical protein
MVVQNFIKSLRETPFAKRPLTISPASLSGFLPIIPPPFSVYGHPDYRVYKTI